MAFKFMKTGADSAALAAKAAAEAKARAEGQGKLFRFWLKEGEEGRITFVDGDLSPEGFLCPPRYYEHNLFLNGSWNNYFICPTLTNPGTKDVCPICASPDRPSLVALFTIIDHRTYQGKGKDKVWKDTKKLLIAKPQTFEILNRLALKRGGLTGCTFDVSRVGEKSASVGTLFDFVEKHSVAELQKLYVTDRVDPKTNNKFKETYFMPADYEKEIPYRTGEQLMALGLGQPGAVPPPSTTPGQKPVDYADQL